MATDLRHQLLDEIALEGLDGITLQALWIRLNDRPDFKLSLDDVSKNYFWNCILCQREVEFYKLVEARPDLVAYNRFHYVDPETHHFLETEHTPEDIYPVKVVNDHGIRGSCPTYDTRTNITNEIHNGETRMTLQEAIERYGNHLVLVASQAVRWRTLIGEMSDPNYLLTDVQYCVIERIARARHQGELSVGKQSLSAFQESSKTIFYLIKCISALGLLTKQGVTVVRKPSNSKVHCMLFHLKRFHVVVKQRWIYEIYQVAEYLDTFPNKQVKVSTMRAHFNFKDTNYKKIIKKTDAVGDRFFEFREVPYRLVYPDAPAKEYIAKNLKGERMLRHVKLIKHPKDAVLPDGLEQGDSDDEDDEQEEGTGDEVPFEPVYDKPVLAQMYTFIKNHGSQGVAQRVIEQAMNLDRLTVRRRLKMLILQGSVTSVLHDFGKTKCSWYVSKDALEENPIHQSVTAEIKKFDELTVEKKTKPKSKPVKQQFKKASDIEIKLNTEPPSDKRTREIKAELEHVELGNSQAFKKPLNPEQEKAMAERLEAPSSSTFENVTIEEQPLHMKKETTKRHNEKTGMLRFGTLLTETHIRRANWIIEIVQAIKLLEEYQLTKILRHREEQMKAGFHMDRKSLKRIVNALVEEQKVRAMKVTIKVDTKEKTMHFVTDVDVSPTSEVMRKALEEAKLKHFSISKEELKGLSKIKRVDGPPGEKPPSPPKKKKFSSEVPESAVESILKHQDFRKRLSNKPPPMKYNNKAGALFGLLPKFVRAQKVHHVLWYLCYETYGKTMTPLAQVNTEYGESGETVDSLINVTEKIPITDTTSEQSGSETMKEPPLYVDELSWKRYMAPVPLHEGYSRGWCFVSDVLLQLPCVIFCQIVNVCYDIPGLLEILSHPIQKFYPIKYLPFSISQQLLFARRYVHAFHDICVCLCEMGLLTFGPDSMKQKELTFIYVHKNVSLLDTRESLLGYNKTRAPPGTEFPRKNYELTSEEVFTNFWEELQIISMGSNMGFKSALDPSDTETHEELSFKDALIRRTPATISDAGLIPGDLRGAAGMDSSIYSHYLRSWTKDRSKWKCAKLERYHGRKIPKEELPPPEPEKEDLSAEKGKKSKFAGGAGKKWKLKFTKNVKGNRGGKGVKKSREPLSSASIGTYNRRRNLALIHKPRQKWRKKPVEERGDMIDKSIFNDRKKQRCVWSPQEDSLLLICNVASLLMEQHRKTLIVPYPVVRDILREKCMELSYDKTSMACARRLKFAMKNPITVQNTSLFFQEASQDPYIIREYINRYWVATDQHLIIPRFKALVNYLAKKFHTLSVGKCALPETLEELEACSIQIVGSTLNTKRVFQDITSKTDICSDVLRNILHGAVLLRDKQGRAHEMFKLLTQYPDNLLGSVISSMRTDGILVINKAAFKVASRITPGIGLRNFKASQKYMYNYKQRYLSALFEDSGKFMNSLVTAHRENRGVELEFTPKNCQAVILMPLMLLKKIEMKVTLPEELVIVDLEGFYRFPWGRGKMGSKSEKCKQSAESLQEFFPGTDLKKLKLPKESTPAPGNEELAAIDEESDDEDSASATESRMKVDSSKPRDSEDKLVDGESLGSAKESRVNADISKPVDSGAKLDDTEKTSTVDEVGEISEAPSETSNVESVKESEINMDAGSVTKAFNIKKSSSSGDTNDVEPPKRQVDSAPASEKQGKAKSDDKGSEKTTEKADTSEKPKVHYDVVKHGSSEMLLPQYELFFKEISQEQSTIASRTLLSLRRSDEEALDEIRIFNAQDNFVVNSCAILVKLKDNEKSAANDEGSVRSKANQDMDSVKDSESAKGVHERTFGDSEKETGASVSSDVMNKVTDVHTVTEDLEPTSTVSEPDSQEISKTSSETVSVEFESTHSNIEIQKTGKQRKEYMNKKDVYWRSRREARDLEDREREKILGSLFLSKEKIWEVWNNLQLILPFQLDMEDVWKHIKTRGLPTSEMGKCQEIYDVIETAGELGIKEDDLQKLVGRECPWKKLVQILIKEMAAMMSISSQENW